ALSASNTNIAVSLNRLQSAQDVEHSAPLKIAIAAEVRGGLAEDVFDLLGPSEELVVAGHQKSCGAADVRRGHARSVFQSVRNARKRSGDLLARRHEIGFDAAVAGRSAARKVTDAVRVRPEAVRRADGDDGVGVAGIGDADAVVRLAQPLLGRISPVSLVSGG